MNGKLTKLIGALSIATLCSTVGCRSDGDKGAEGGDPNAQGQASPSCGAGKSCGTDEGGAQNACGGGGGAR